MITALLYWGLLGLMILLFSSHNRMKGWFKKPYYNKIWLIAGVLIGLFPVLGILLPNYNLLFYYPGLSILVILFAAINPWFEEGYWRGLLLDAGENFPIWVRLIYSSALFSFSHPLMWGVFSIGNRSYQLLLTLFVMGIAWSFIRYKMKSLRWSVYSHILVDLGNLSVFVFLNIYIPPGM